MIYKHALMSWGLELSFGAAASPDLLGFVSKGAFFLRVKEINAKTDLSVSFAEQKALGSKAVDEIPRSLTRKESF
jgi:hypothetical protein